MAEEVGVDELAPRGGEDVAGDEANLRKEVKKVRDEAEQERVACNHMRDTLAGLRKQVDDLSVVNLALKGEARRKDEEMKSLLAAATQQCAATRDAAKASTKQLANELD